MTKEQIEDEAGKALIALELMEANDMITSQDRARLSKKVKVWWYDQMKEAKEPTL